VISTLLRAAACAGAAVVGGMNPSGEINREVMKKHLLTPIIILCYFTAISMAPSFFALDRFTERAMLPLALIFGALIPTAAFAAGKLRGKM